jgi:crotonobetaine/carnitine-CoA ligase
VNFRVWLESLVARYGSAPFLLFQDEVVSFAAFNSRVDALARAFADLGVRPRDNIVLLLPNHPVYLYAWFGLAKIGARAVLLNTALRGEGLAHLLQLSGARLAVVDAALAPVLDEAARHTPLEQILWFPEAPTDAGLSLWDLLARYEGEHAPAWSPDGTDAMAMVATSGTTGPAKLCVLSHRYYLALARFIRTLFELTPADVVYDPLPLFHINPHYAVLGALAAGSRLVLPERFSASGFWGEVERYGATVVVLHLWPIGVLKKQGSPSHHPHRIRLAFPADREFMELFNIQAMATGYGSTEAGGLTTGRIFRTPLPPELGVQEPLSSITGSPRQDVELAILDAEDQPLPPGQVGEIAIRPRQPHVIFDGYFNMPERTLRSLRNLWFHTGDLGYLDDEGQLHFLGRASESIRVRGEFVPIDELENAIRRHPSVQDAAVIGVAGEIADEEILAVVEVKEGRQLHPSELVTFLQGKVAHFMIPRYYRLQPLPRIPGTGKVRKDQISRDLRTAWDRKASG